MLLEDDWEDFRRTTAGRRFEDAEPAINAAFFLPFPELLVPFEGSGGVPREGEEAAWLVAADRDARSYTEGLVRFASAVSEPLPLLLLRSNDIADGARGEGSSSPLVRLGVFEFGVRILAVLDSCLVDSVLIFFNIGGGLEEPRLRPFSSSIVGGLGASEARLDGSMDFVSSSPLL